MTNMTATQGTMADMSSANTAYLSTEEPELGSINFRQSLRFFQEQLISSKGFPSSPSSTSKFCIDFVNDHSKSEESKSLSSSRISIPTVDTILESVRVLRAIQKSQEQRGSTWSLDLVKTDDDLEIQHSSLFKELERNVSVITNGNQYNDTLPTSMEDKPCVSAMDTYNENGVMKKKCTLFNEILTFWPSNNVVKQEMSSTKNEENVNETLEMQTSVEFQIQNPSFSKYVINNINDETTASILRENVQELVNIRNNQDNLETTITNACADSGTEEENKQEKLLDIFDFPITVKETSEHELKLLIEAAKPVEINLKEEIIQNKVLYVETENNDQDIVDEDSEYFYITESHTVQSGQTPKSASLDYDGAQNASNSHPCRQLRPESRSDTCSSIYVSAEGSPCPSLYNDSNASSQVLDKIQAYSSQCGNELKKDSNFDTWTTDSFGIDTDFTNGSRNNENTLSRPSTPISNIILDNFVIPDILPKEVCISQTSSEDITNIVDKNNTQLTSEETANLKTTAKDSYNSSTVTNISPSPTLNKSSINIDFNNSTNVTKSYKSEDCSNKTEENESESNIDASNASPDIIDEVPDDNKIIKPKETDEGNEVHGIKKFTTSSWNLETITESLYTLTEPMPSKVYPELHDFQRTVLVMSQGAFLKYPEGYYILELHEHVLQIKQDANSLITIPLIYAEVCISNGNVLKVDNRLGKCLCFKTETHKEQMELKEELELHCSKCWESEKLNLVHYPMKCHQNVVIIDLGSCSTRAGILMDQPTLPFLFFPSICAIDKKTGNHVYGKEALQLKVRQNSNLSFPLRPSIKIIKHSIDIDVIGGLFKKIFQDLRVDPGQYIVQVCLPRSLSISAQNALVKLLLEDVKVQSVSLTHQALLTLYAHKVSTGVVVDIGDRMDILPVVEGFIVESGVTRLPYGGQRLIHHMKHALAEKHISLSNDIDSFVVQYISENLTYVAEDYDTEIKIATEYPDMVKKTITLETFARDDKCAQHATLDDARFKTPEGLFKPELWGLDNQGIHKLVHKAIHATSVDVRKKIAENIYVSGGVTLIPGFVERLIKDVSDLNKPRIVPKVIASNYRYHSTYIGACEFARMDVFSKVCVNLEEYSKNQISSLKKFALCF